MFGGQKAQAPPAAGSGKIEDDQPKEEVSQGSKVVNMKPGDYLVHVHI